MMTMTAPAAGGLGTSTSKDTNNSSIKCSSSQSDKSSVAGMFAYCLCYFKCIVLYKPRLDYFTVFCSILQSQGL